jgi:hypothetical protein
MAGVYAEGSGRGLYDCSEDCLTPILLITEIARGVCFSAWLFLILVLTKHSRKRSMQPLTALLVHLAALAVTTLGIGCLALLLGWAGRLVF